MLEVLTMKGWMNFACWCVCLNNYDDTGRHIHENDTLHATVAQIVCAQEHLGLLALWEMGPNCFSLLNWSCQKLEENIMGPLG